MVDIKTVFDNGWVKLESNAPLVGQFWLEGFPTIEDETKRNLHGRGPNKRSSPIYDYDDGGIGAIQWLNLTHDVAAIVKADGGWKTGGNFHLWISPGAGRPPYEISLIPKIEVVEGDSDGWIVQKENAERRAEQLLGLTVIGESVGGQSSDLMHRRGRPKRLSEFFSIPRKNRA